MLINPAIRVTGSLYVPGDKAISHRAVLIGAGIGGTTSIVGISPAADVASSLRSARTMGARLLDRDSNPLPEGFQPSHSALASLKLEGLSPEASLPPDREIDCGNSGTTMRLLMGIHAGTPGRTILLGDDSLSRRPMARVADPLRLMGASIDLSTKGTAPVVVSGASLHGIEYRLPIASAQVKTALMLAGLRADGVTTLIEPSPSRDHTERLLRFLGMETVDEQGRIVVKRTELFSDKEIDIPGDISSASFLLTAAAVLPESDLTISGVGLNPTRTAFLDILRAFGAIVEVSAEREVSGEPRGTVRVRFGEMRPVHVGADQVPGAIDELPLVAVLGSFADGETILSGAGELRIKESDRIHAMTSGLAKMGADISPTADGFIVRGPARLSGATVESFGDHRIAMALAIAGLGARGETIIEGSDAVGVSYPDFFSDLASIVER